MPSQVPRENCHLSHHLHHVLFNTVPGNDSYFLYLCGKQTFVAADSICLIPDIEDGQIYKTKIFIFRLWVTGIAAPG